MRFNFSRTCAALAVCAAFTAPLAAQATHPTTTVIPKQPIAPMHPTMTRPVTPPANPPANPPATQTSLVVPQGGPYTLAMTATKINGHPAGSNHVVSENVGVSWNGATVSIAGGGLTLQGQVTNNHLAVASSTPDDGSLSLSGTPAAHYASGTFSLTHADGKTASGGFTLTAPSAQHMLKKIKAYGGPTPAPPVDPCGFWCNFSKFF